MYNHVPPNGMAPQQQQSSSSSQPPSSSSITHNPSLVHQRLYPGYPPPSSESTAHLPPHTSYSVPPPTASYNHSGIQSLPPSSTTTNSASHHALVPPVPYYRHHHVQTSGNVLGTHPPPPPGYPSHTLHPGAQYSTTHHSSMTLQHANPHSMVPTRSSPSSSATSAEEERPNSSNRISTQNSTFSPWYSTPSGHHGHPPPPPLYTSHPHSFHPHSASSNLMENGGSMIPPSSQHHHLFKSHPSQHMGGNGVMKYGTSGDPNLGRPFTDYQQVVHNNSHIMPSSSGIDPYHSTTIPPSAMNVWRKLITEMVLNSGSKKPKNELPLARIKKIMKSDEEVRTKTMISAEAPVLFAKACEMFIIELTLHAWVHTEEAKRRTLQRNDIAAAIGKTDVFDFLIDIVPRETEKVQHSSHKANDDSYAHSETARHARASRGKSTNETNAEDELTNETTDGEDEVFGAHMLIDTQSTKGDAPSPQGHLNVATSTSVSGGLDVIKPLDSTTLKAQHVSALLQPSLIPSTNINNSSHNFNPSMLTSTGSTFSLASSSSSAANMGASHVLGNSSNNNNTNFLHGNNKSSLNSNTNTQTSETSDSALAFSSYGQHQPPQQSHGDENAQVGSGLPSALSISSSMVSFSSVDSTNESAASDLNQQIEPVEQANAKNNSVGTTEETRAAQHHSMSPTEHDFEIQVNQTEVPAVQTPADNHQHSETYSFQLFQ
ncbi:hypothetical protein C9374_012681 [Naegleria lovaniensis]|uniref:Transcription factor CBF/NF-Y/archaeal histone domain-containing protein n=1 Tax=Naegleria lovaniensis TaxID=51637 RepID=A0AA88GXL5_NAELO|nr:uncharacterized protein C9374_012681 [Naegleria lovaniensis]KAG2392429.1 hypothetical protein C9374_012681 [Naegleria lovaniensis]